MIDPVKAYGKPVVHELSYPTGNIYGRGKTKAEAKKDALRQKKMADKNLPKNMQNMTRQNGPRVKNSEDSKRTWYKHLSQKAVRWDKAIKYIVESGLGLPEIARLLKVEHEKVLNWERRTSVPPSGVRDDLCDLIAKHVSRTNRLLCNLDIPD